MNPKTLQEYNAICDKAQKDILQAKTTGITIESIHFSVLIELLTLVLIRIDQIETTVGK